MYPPCIYCNIITKSIQVVRIIFKLIHFSTFEYVAENVNISPDLLRNIENGRNIGSVPTLLNLCNFLEITPDFLFEPLITTRKDTLDTVLQKQLASISKEDKKILKQIIIHIDKNY